MTPQETVQLARYVKALCPQQRFDEYTPNAWHDLLGRYQLTDARQAAAAVASRQAFVAPSEIITEIRRIRAARIEAANVLYDGDPTESPIDSVTNRRELLRAAGDGRLGTRTTQQALPTDRRPLELEAGPLGRLQMALAAIGTTPPRAIPGVANALAVPCPKCKAHPGRPCTSGRSDKPRRHADPHPSRTDLARTRAAGLDQDAS
ncbi:hypothetical protein GCM10010193_69530 [Kitasatospora atroaurantiaca]|uniref:DNA-binding phage zinc finger domain-containing protein n=1 Tax=Kitasatospora atroaurantiaca TaxID=285545 RepID=A0A561EN54_9ACTN|nr:hypothetical protein [Kitasatospora atroaurantiaca]TWE17040.1 hypothetical protein FB465_2044 [Kitasatospora atroaurantiaca]